MLPGQIIDEPGMTMRSNQQMSATASHKNWIARSQATKARLAQRNNSQASTPAPRLAREVVAINDDKDTTTTTGGAATAGGSGSSRLGAPAATGQQPTRAVAIQEASLPAARPLNAVTGNTSPSVTSHTACVNCGYRPQQSDNLDHLSLGNRPPRSGSQASNLNPAAPVQTPGGPVLGRPTAATYYGSRPSVAVPGPRSNAVPARPAAGSAVVATSAGLARPSSNPPRRGAPEAVSGGPVSRAPAGLFDADEEFDW